MWTRVPAGAGYWDSGVGRVVLIARPGLALFTLRWRRPGVEEVATEVELLLGRLLAGSGI